MQLAESLLTVVGYNAMTELGWISEIVSRETDDSVAVKLEKELAGSGQNKGDIIRCIY